MPTKTWAVGEEVLAADFNALVQRQVVATFPNAAARNAAIVSPAPGMVTYLEDVKGFQYWDGAAWPFLAFPTMRANGTTTATRLRAGSVVLSCDPSGSIVVPWTPPLGDVVSITSTPVPGDQSPQIAVPIRGQFVRGATTSQWRFVMGNGTFLSNAVVVLEYTLVEVP